MEDGNGGTINTCVTYVKDINAFIDFIVRGKKIKDPVILLSYDKKNKVLQNMVYLY